MKKVRKAVIPAAGLGTRVLPATKAMPKEMLPIVDKPAIQYIVEEAAAAGIEDILIITNRGKGLLEDHFDRAPELEARLTGSPEKEAVLEQVVAISRLANIFYVRQKETKGLGHAILCAKEFVGDEPFAVLYGDDVILGEDPACGQLIRAWERYGKGVVGVKEVSEEAIKKYSSLKVEPLEGNCFSCTDMVEKPQRKEDILSLYSILGRCVLPPEIFGILERTAPGAGGEIQLTDAMKELARRDGMTAVDFTGTAVRHGQQAGDFAGHGGGGPAAPGDRPGLPGLPERAEQDAVTRRASPRGRPFSKKVRKGEGHGERLFSQLQLYQGQPRGRKRAAGLSQREDAGGGVLPVRQDPLARRGTRRCTSARPAGRHWRQNRAISWCWRTCSCGWRSRRTFPGRTTAVLP